MRQRMLAQLVRNRSASQKVTGSVPTANTRWWEIYKYLISGQFVSTFVSAHWAWRHALAQLRILAFNPSKFLFTKKSKENDARFGLMHRKTQPTTEETKNVNLHKEKNQLYLLEYKDENIEQKITMIKQNMSLTAHKLKLTQQMFHIIRKHMFKKLVWTCYKM